MQSILIAYASQDGQAQYIAQKLAEHLQNARLTSLVQNLHTAATDKNQIAKSMLVVLVAAVRYGKHLPAATQWLTQNHAILSTRPMAVVSVNLTARHLQKRDSQHNTYLRKLLHQHQLKPVAACAIAGKLDYPNYRWIDRQMIRMIMLLTGGPTNPKVSTEFTDWSEVSAFARQLSQILIPQNGNGSVAKKLG